MTWNLPVREKAQELLERRIQIGTHIQFMFEAELIENELALLGGVDPQSTLFRMSLNDVIGSGNTSIANFENIYEQRVNFHNSVFSYDIYFPLYLNFPKRKFKIHDLTVDKVPFKKIYKFFSRDNLINAVTKAGVSNFNLNTIPIHALNFTITANNKIEAWHKISDQFSQLRGIIDYSLLSDQINYTFGTFSRTKNDHPQWGLFRNTNNNTSEFITFRVAKDPRKSNHKLTQKQNEKFHTLQKILRIKPESDSSINVLADCLRLYGQAMESVHNHNCFLSLWQLAESLTRSEISGGQTKKVLDRLKWHSTSHTSIRKLDISLSLQELSTKRNELVHKGIDRIENYDINLLKTFCDLGIKWLFQTHKKLKTINHLDEFYRLRTSPDKVKKAIVETVKSL